MNLKNEKLKIKELKLNKVSGIALLKAFYSDVYEINFPDENERESIENMILQSQRFDNLQNFYKIILGYINNKAVGGLIGNIFCDINAAVVEFIVIDSSFRKRGIASSLIDYFVNSAKNLCVKNNSSLKYIFLEVDNPRHFKDEKKAAAVSRIEFWNKMGAKKLDINYIQPPLAEDKDEVTCLNILSIALNNEKFLEKEVVLGFLYRFFKYAFGIGDVKDNKFYKDIEFQLNSLNNVKLESLYDSCISSNSSK